MIRLGLIGCGKWGQRYIPSSNDTGNAMVTHVARPSVTGLLAASGLAMVDDWRKLKDAPIDGFIVATPPSSHADICEEILSWGRPVMVEKPMALSAFDACRLRDATKKTTVPLLVNHLHLYAPAYESLRDIMVSYQKSYSLYGRAGNIGPYRDYSALWDYGSHDLSMCLGLNPGTVGLVQCDRSPDGIGWAFNLRIEFAGSTAHIQSWNGSSEKTRHFEVFGDGIHLVYDELNEMGVLLRHNGNPVSVSLEKPLTRSIRAFAEAIKTGNTDWRFGTDIACSTTEILSYAEQLAAGQTPSTG